MGTRFVVSISFGTQWLRRTSTRRRLRCQTEVKSRLALELIGQGGRGDTSSPFGGADNEFQPVITQYTPTGHPTAAVPSILKPPTCESSQVSSEYRSTTDTEPPDPSCGQHTLA
ncbi:hypothetical protein BJV78DRAFT_119912 [Lactifluus subvellereus]|nr:hypothetical protein BJV78DRAFT_119912 [Lactifluus subvellereus]